MNNHISNIRKFFTGLLLAVSLSVGACPVNSVPQKIYQPDGTYLILTPYGDEFFSWCEDDKGNQYYQGSDGYWRIDPNAVKQRQAVAKRERERIEQLNYQIRQIKKRSNTDKTPRYYQVLMIETPDEKFSRLELESYHYLFNGRYGQNGYESFLSKESLSGSLSEYYYENSNGVFDSWFSINKVTLDKEMSFYGTDTETNRDVNIYKMADEALDAFYSGKSEWSNKDMIPSGELSDADNSQAYDALIIFYAGVGQSDNPSMTSLIWPCCRCWTYSHTLPDGQTIKFDNVVYSSERNYQNHLNFGTLCHEFGHSLGLPDLYDVDGETNGYAKNLPGKYMVMCKGGQNSYGLIPPALSSVERELLGWALPSALKPWSMSQLKSISDNTFIRYESPTHPGEYLYIEYRDYSNKWDRGIMSYPATMGNLMIYHVDKSEDSTPESSSMTYLNLWQTYAPNNYANHPACCMQDYNGICDAYTWTNKPFGVVIDQISYSTNHYCEFRVLGGESSEPNKTGCIVRFIDASGKDLSNLEIEPKSSSSPQPVKISENIYYITRTIGVMEPLSYRIFGYNDIIIDISDQTEELYYYHEIILSSGTQPIYAELSNYSSASISSKITTVSQDNTLWQKINAEQLYGYSRKYNNRPIISISSLVQADTILISQNGKISKIPHDIQEVPSSLYLTPNETFEVGLKFSKPVHISLYTIQDVVPNAEIEYSTHRESLSGNFIPLAITIQTNGDQPHDKPEPLLLPDIETSVDENGVVNIRVKNAEAYQTVEYYLNNTKLSSRSATLSEGWNEIKVKLYGDDSKECTIRKYILLN